jgi:hypothetical protein
MYGLRVTLTRFVAIVAITSAAGLAAGCSSGHRSERSGQPAVASHGPSTDPKVAAAARAAQDATDRQLSGDYAGAWETYTAAGKAAIGKADFVRLQTACPPKGLHQRARVVDGRLEDANTVVVRVNLSGGIAARTLRYEGGKWLIEPSDTAAADFKLGVDQAVAKKKAAGTC